MSDTGPSNQQVARIEGKTGLGKIGCSIISALLSSYLLNKASLHGVNFELLGVSSEVVKASIDGALTGILVGLTPTHFVASLCDAIVFVKSAFRQIGKAWTSN